jgi:hypothetical protein
MTAKRKRLMSSFFGLLLTMAICLLAATTGLAQNIVSGELSGMVTDASSAVVPNAAVTLTSKDYGNTADATTNAAGFFRFALLRPGNYTVTVKASGFAVITRNAVVSLGQVTTVPIQLNVQGGKEVVEVTSEASLVQTENANLTANFSRSQIETLPSPGQDMTNYALMAPGVTLSTGAGYGNFTANGLPGTSNLYTINGGDMNDPYNNLNNSGSSNNMLGTNEVQEVTLVTNGYTGQYGRAASVNMNVTTRSGTNQFHGDGSWWWNGRAMNANDWFQNNSGTPRGFANSNQWAGSIGGPIKKDKLFFYFDTEGLRYVLFAPALVYVPSPQFQQSTIQNLTAQGGVPAQEVGFYKNIFNIYNGANGIQRATPVTSTEDPTLGCGSFAGTPTGLAGGGTFGVDTPCSLTFRGGNNNLNKEWLMSVRVDWLPTDKDKFSFRYWQDRGQQPTFTDPIDPIFNAGSNQPQDAGQMTYTRVISPTMVNQLILGGFYYSAVFKLPNMAASQAVFPSTILWNDGSPFNNMGGTMYAYPQGRRVAQIQAVDDFSWTKGNHDLKFGVNFRQNNITDLTPYRNTSGELFVFALGSFYNGVIDRLTQRYENATSAPLQYYSLGLYAQDTWKVNPKLTLTLSLRADRNSNEECKNNCFSRFITGSFLTTDHSQPTYNASINPHFRQAFNGLQAIVWQPRVGFAYNPWGSKTVFRGGFGLFSDMYPGQIAERFVSNAPYVASFNVSGYIEPGVKGSAFSGAAGSYAALVNGFNAGQTLAQIQAAAQAAGGAFTPPAFSSSVANASNPTYMEWNFQLEQAVGSKSSMSLNYVGNHGYNLFMVNPGYNTYCSGSRGCTPGFGGLPLVVPDPRFNAVTQINNQGYSNYNGLTGSYTLTAAYGWSFNVNYTWSHALDTISNGGLQKYSTIQTSDSLEFQINPFSVRQLNYGSSDYDFRQVFNANYTWNLPYKFSNAFANATLSGWTIAGTFHVRSGQPYSVIDSTTPNLLNNGASALVMGTFLGGAVPGCSGPGNPAGGAPYQCLSPSQFMAPGTETNFGNIARNSFRGPGYFDTDMSVYKNFKITERFNLKLGMLFYNILNHANFSNPDGALNDGTFGQVTQTVTPASSPYGNFQGAAVSGRVIQTMIKVQF